MSGIGLCPIYVPILLSKFHTMNDSTNPAGPAENAQPYSPDEIVIREGEDYDVAFFRILNNFHLNFPYGNRPYPCNGPLGPYREAFKIVGEDLMDMTFLQNWEGFLRQSPHSGHYFRTTPRKYYAELDVVAAQTGKPVEHIAELLNIMFVGGRRDEKMWKALFEVLIPIYVEMRKRGYNIHDLRV